MVGRRLKEPWVGKRRRGPTSDHRKPSTPRNNCKKVYKNQEVLFQLPVFLIVEPKLIQRFTRIEALLPAAKQATQESRQGKLYKREVLREKERLSSWLTYLGPT